MISSKINTLLQLLYVLAVVAHAGYGLPPQRCGRCAALLPICITRAAQRFSYVREFTRRALQVARA